MTTEKKDTTYNGWTNYETWNVALWMDNEEGAYDSFRDLAKETFENAEKDGTFSKEERAKLDLMSVIKEEFENGIPVLDPK